MKIVSINMVIELNNLLKEENVKIHLRDACGKQSLWIEKLNSDTITQKAYDIITEYFKKEKFNVFFSDDKIHFWVE